jgi:RNA polymerase sigma-70 factor (ECF subfamily)
MVRVSPDFADFYRSEFGDLAGYAWSLTRDAHLADELAQEAMTRICARWGLLRDPRPYAFRIVSNLAKDAWRREQRERPADDERQLEQTVAGPDSATLDAVRRLPDPLREVVMLHYYADLPVAEIARVVRRPVGTVKRRLHDARAQLSIALEGDR